MMEKVTRADSMLMQWTIGVTYARYFCPHNGDSYNTVHYDVHSPGDNVVATLHIVSIFLYSIIH